MALARSRRSSSGGYPQVRWLGLLPRDELAKVYAAADLFVFPSRADTFGLVMVEAMATGTPVAAYPVDGPLEVLGRRDAQGRSLGGAMHEDLQKACFAALAVPRHEARAARAGFQLAACHCPVHQLPGPRAPTFVLDAAQAVAVSSASSIP